MYVKDGNLFDISVVNLVLGFGIVFIFILFLCVLIINLYFGLLINGNLVFDINVIFKLVCNCLIK